MRSKRIGGADDPVVAIRHQRLDDPGEHGEGCQMKLASSPACRQSRMDAEARALDHPVGRLEQTICQQLRKCLFQHARIDAGKKTCAADDRLTADGREDVGRVQIIVLIPFAGINDGNGHPPNTSAPRRCICVRRF